MAAKVPTTESGRARLGMIVADTLRRKAKITSTTSTSAASMVSFTSRTEARMDCERPNRISPCTEGGSHAVPHHGRDARRRRDELAPERLAVVVERPERERRGR